jgi:hypothetical protein
MQVPRWSHSPAADANSRCGGLFHVAAPKSGICDDHGGHAKEPLIWFFPAQGLSSGCRWAGRIQTCDPLTLCGSWLTRWLCKKSHSCSRIVFGRSSSSVMRCRGRHVYEIPRSDVFRVRTDCRCQRGRCSACNLRASGFPCQIITWSSRVCRLSANCRRWLRPIRSTVRCAHVR